MPLYIRLKKIIRQEEKGGPGSGNWAHIGRPGIRGGSSPRNQGMTMVRGADWLNRYESASGKPHPYAIELHADKKKREENKSKIIARFQEGRASLQDVANALGVSESEAQGAVGTGKRAYSRHPQPDRSGGIDFYEMVSGSSYTMKKDATELPGQIVVDNASGKMSMAMNYARNGARADYADISYYGDVKAKPMQQVKIARSMMLQPWRVESPGVGSKLFGKSADVESVKNISKAAAHMVKAGFPANQLLEMQVGPRLLSGTLNQWMQGKVE